MNSPASASWIPVCLPKFNPAGFVNAYITFLRRPDADQKSYQRTARDTEKGVAETSASDIAESSQGITSWQTTRLIEDSGIGLVCISGGGEFETVRAWCDTVTQVCSKPCFPEHVHVADFAAEIERRWIPRGDGQSCRLWADKLLRIPVRNTWIASLCV